MFTYGRAYGSGDKAFAGRKTSVAVSPGAPAADYRPNGEVGYTLEEVLRPFELAANYIGAAYQPHFAFHTIDSNAVYDAAARLVADSTDAYQAHLTRYFPQVVRLARL